MDAVSYSHADKQKQRIEKFIKQPDSTSGIVTVPDTIASGESIEIATGRQIVVDHLDVQGTLDIQGTLATVTGGYLSQTTMKTQSIINSSNSSSPVDFPVTPTAPTASAGTNSTKIATTAFVNNEIANDVGVANSSLVKTALNASGLSPIFAIRAFCNFNGQNTVAIRKSGNISSISDLGTGYYRANLISAMSDRNYSVIFGSYGMQYGGSYNATLEYGLYNKGDNGSGQKETTHFYIGACWGAVNYFAQIDLETIEFAVME